MNATAAVSATTNSPQVLPSFQEIPLSKIRESQTNPRRQFDETNLAELADNIKQYGVLQPILVRPHLKCCGVNNWVEVAGVVGDVRQDGLAVPSRPEIYFPLSREDFQSPMYLVARSTLPPAALIREIENGILAIDPQIPLSDVKTGQQVVQSWAANLPYQTRPCFWQASL